MRSFFFLFILLISTACQTNPLRSLEHHLGVSKLASLKRAANQERWELTDNPDWNRALILKDLQILGFVEAVKPGKKHYQTAVLLGSTGPRMQDRIDYLVKTWVDGVRFKRIVFLTGDRDLIEIDGPHALKNETQLFQYLWAHTNLPKDLKKLPTLWIDAPKIGNKRPTTVSTIIEWRKQENLDHEDILAFSNQPFVRYQECALLNYLPEMAKVSAAGPAATPDTLIQVYIDALVNCQEFCPVN